MGNICKIETNKPLNNLQNTKFLTKRIFQRMSENMHYEIFKFINSEELLEVRAINLGGYQLTSNPILRSRIKNYFDRIPLFFYDITMKKTIDKKEYKRIILLLLQQTGNLSLVRTELNSKRIKQLEEILTDSLTHVFDVNLSNLTGVNENFLTCDQVSKFVGLFKYFSRVRSLNMGILYSLSKVVYLYMRIIL